MKLPDKDLNSLWASLLVEELIRNGVDQFCLSPGYRCAPLSMAVAENPKAKSVIHYDERGLAFYALGIGRATGRPAAVINTSGTAVVNGWPAVVEAAMERIPLVLLTADRPPELRGTAANQTIDQVKIFGDYVRWFVDLPCPSLTMPPEMVLSTVDQAVYRSRGALGGPVHINCMYREPLVPEPEGESLGHYLDSVSSWLDNEQPYTQYVLPKSVCGPGVLERLERLLGRTARGLVIVGGLRSAAERTAVSDLVQKLGWPVCADITSGLPLGATARNLIAQSEMLVTHERFARDHRPEVVLHFGGRFVSKHLAAFVRDSNPAEYIMIADHPERQDPGHEVTLRIEADLKGLCEALVKRLSLKEESPWVLSWQKGMAAMQGVLTRFADHGEDLSEPICACLVSRNLPAEHGLFLASSMPVRDMNLFGDSKGPAVHVGANRGASGVDGTIAAATGFAAGLRRPVTLLMGDLAFLHDLNSLNLARKSDYPIIIIVMNNNGGGIFSFLPVARFEECFEKYFTTPHGLTFESAAGMYGLSYYRPKTRREFLSAYDEAVKGGTSAVIEVIIDRKENHDLHLQLRKEMHNALEA